MQSIEFLKLVHDFLTNKTKLERLFSYFSLFLIEMCLRSRLISALCFSPTAEDRTIGVKPTTTTTTCMIKNLKFELNLKNYIKYS